jgi:tetratricopeptide (TPR) repeat protein
MTASNIFHYFRQFSSKQTNHPANMANLICSFCIFFFSACGPISAYHHAALDTPSRHVDNGLKFLQIDKIDAAVLEFSRASELDPDFAPAYMGLALAYGRMGDFTKGYEFIELAAKNATGYEQESAVKEVRLQLDTLQKKNM